MGPVVCENNFTILFLVWPGKVCYTEAVKEAFSGEERMCASGNETRTEKEAADL